MPHRNLTLFAPTLLPSAAPPTLKQLLARATAFVQPQESHWHTLLHLFGADWHASEVPLAAIMGLAHNLPTYSGWWLRADPVYLMVDLAGLYLAGNTELALSQAESLAFVAELNLFLSSYHMQLYAPQQHEWYLQVPENPQIVTHEIEKVLGKEISAYLPRGTKASVWQRLLLEIQMIMMRSAVNQTRRIANKVPVNSLWFWGSGCLPTVSPKNWNKVGGDTLLLRGLATMTNVTVLDDCQELAGCLPQMLLSGNYLILLDGQPDQIEEHWFKPLLTELRNGTFEKVEAYLGDGYRYEIQATDFQRWWHNLWIKQKK